MFKVFQWKGRKWLNSEAELSHMLFFINVFTIMHQFIFVSKLWLLIQLALKTRFIWQVRLRKPNDSKVNPIKIEVMHHKNKLWLFFNNIGLTPGVNFIQPLAQGEQMVNRVDSKRFCSISWRELCVQLYQYKDLKATLYF